MSKILIIFLLLTTLFFTTVFSQRPKEIDSLLATLPQLHGVEKLIAIGYITNFTFGLPELRKQYLYMYLDEARRQKHIEAESDALTLLTEFYYAQYDNDSVFILGEEAIRFARQHDLYEDLFISHTNCILSYNERGQTLTALRKAEEAYAEAKALHENFNMARMLAVLGGIYHSMEQNEEALRCFSESLELALMERQKDEHLYAENYQWLSSIAGDINLYDKALQYADSMQVEIERLQKSWPQANYQVYNFLEKVYHTMAYAGLGQKEQSLKSLRSAETLFDPQWKGTYQDVVLYTMYIKYYLSTGDFDRALEYIQLKKRYLEDNNMTNELDETDEAEALTGKGDFKAANEAYRQIIHKKDERNREQFYRQINELRIIYELDKSEMLSERRLASIRFQKSVIAGLSVACMAMLIIVAIVVWNRRRIALKNRGLYRQIKEQDRLTEKIEQLEKLLEETKKTEIQAGEEAHPASLEEIQNLKIVSRVKEYLFSDRNFAKPEMNIDKIVETLEISRTYLFQAVKSVTGKTAQDFIHTLRLEEAKRLLEETTELIEIIAQKCGYNKRTFHRQFRELYNITPAEYRETMKREEKRKELA
jgi:AraC-like DNA-binding protein